MRQEAGLSDTTTETKAFSVVHGDEASFESGLRGYFAYRDLGIKAATGGRVGAHVIRAVEGSEPGAEANVTKLIGSEVVQRKGALAARIAGPLRSSYSPRLARSEMVTMPMRTSGMGGIVSRTGGGNGKGNVNGH